VRKLAVDHGAFFGQDEMDRAENVCVLGHTVVNILFMNDDPVGRRFASITSPAR